MRKISGFMVIVLSIILVMALLLDGCSNASPTPTSAPPPPVTSSSAPPPAISTSIAPPPSTSTVAPPTTANTPPPSSAASTEPIKIGFISSLSGMWAGLASYEVPAVQMVVDDINASGGLLGRKVQLLTADDAADPSLVSQRADSLKAQGCVAIMGCMIDPCSAVLGQWAKSNKIPVSSLSDAMVSRTTDFNKYVFFSQPMAWTYAKILTQIISKDPNIKSIYNLALDQAMSHEVYDLLKANLKKSNPAIKDLGESYLPMTESDFSVTISTVMGKKPDFVIDGIAGPPATNFFQQAKLFNLFSKMKFAGAMMLAADWTTPLGKNFPEGLIGMDICPFYLNTPAMKAFTQSFLDKNKLYPGDISITDYICAKAMVQAIKKANSTDPDKIVAAWENMTIDTPTGPITYNDYDHDSNAPVYVATSGFSADFPIVIGLNPVMYQEGMYPTKDDITALRSAK